MLIGIIWESTSNLRIFYGCMLHKRGIKYTKRDIISPRINILLVGEKQGIFKKGGISFL